MILIWVLLIILVVLYFDKIQDQPKYIPDSKNPHEILLKRYISDEIGEDEYQRIKLLLNKRR